MTLQELIFNKLLSLSPQEQLRVWKFVADLPAAPHKHKSIIGLFEGRGVHIDEAGIAQVREEAWRNFPRELPETEEE
jgi:hypothetical protein